MTLTQADVIRIQATPSSHYDNIKEGPVSTVARAWLSMKNGEPQWIVVKSAPVIRKFSREPHDIRKELRILTTLSHRNIVSVLGSFEDEKNHALKLYMPYIPVSLADLLSSPYFSPHPLPPLRRPDESVARSHEVQFTTIARSIIFQILCAVAYLHDETRLIAHRDIKPENILITKEGCVKLIDFGVCYNGKEPGYSKQYDLWPEYKGKLYFEVCTGAYRAPELLFGTRDYDPLAVDLWSLGATLAEFFTPLRLSSDDTDDGDDDDDTDNSYTDVEMSPIQPFVIPRYLRIGYPGAQWHRDTLFNGDRGEIGLAWSIFKIYGTPTLDNWPEFDELPSAKSVVFNVVPAVPVEPLLPNLPPSTRSSDPGSHSTPSPNSSQHQHHPNGGIIGSQPSTPKAYRHPASDPVLKSTPFDLLSRFLVYSSASRQTAVQALCHPWLAADSQILLPVGYEFDNVYHQPQHNGHHRRSGSVGSNGIGAHRSAMNGRGGGSGSGSGTRVPAVGASAGVNGSVAGNGAGATNGFSHLRRMGVYEWNGKPLGEWVYSLLTIPGAQ